MVKEFGNEFVFVRVGKVEKVIRNDFFIFFDEIFDWVVDFFSEVVYSECGSCVFCYEVVFWKFCCGGVYFDSSIFVFEVFVEIFE